MNFEPFLSLLDPPERTLALAHLKRNQFGAAQGGGEADEQQRAVTFSNKRVWQRRYSLAEPAREEGRLLPCRSAVFVADALPDVAEGDAAGLRSTPIC